jgi:hypothetical protein
MKLVKESDRWVLSFESDANHNYHEEKEFMKQLLSLETLGCQISFPLDIKLCRDNK